MDTYFWGPNLWNSLHSITFDYPDQPTTQDQQQYKQFFHSLKYVLPCAACRKHYSHGLEVTMPIDPALKNRDTLTRWLVQFHNSVNERLGKPVVTYESVKDKYEAMRGKCQLPTSCNARARKKTDSLLYVVIILLILVILLVIYHLYNKDVFSKKRAVY